MLIFALGIVSVPDPRPHHAREHAPVVAAGVRAGRARAGRDQPAGHGARGAAQRAARDVLDRAARHRGRDRRRGWARRSSASACSAPAVSWGNMIAAARGRPADAAVRAVRADRSASSSPCSRSTTSATSSAPASTCGRARCEPAASPRRRPTDSPTHRSTVRCSRSTSVQTLLQDAARARARGRRRLVHARAGQDARHRRRVGLAASRCSRGRSWACLPSNVERHGSIKFEGHEIGNASSDEMRHYWGTQMSMVFQDPMTSLNPVMRIGKQITESLRFHLDVSRDYAEDTALALLQSVGIPEAERRLRRVPAPAVRRHAPARDDRDRARVRPEAAVRRRADDRARRHGAGADPRPAARAAARAVHGDGARHARPRRRRRPRRRHRGDVRGPHRRVRADARAVQRDAPPVHRGVAEVDPEARRSRATRGSRRSPAARPTS